MKKFISAILLLIALFSLGCQKSAQDEEETQILTYNWDDKGISFDYDSSYHIHNLEDTLFITTSKTISPPPGEVMMELMITYSDGSLEDNIKTYDSYMSYTKQDLMMGAKPVTMIKYISELAPDYTYTVMLFETENGVISFVPGLNHEKLAEDILTSVNAL